MRLEGLPLDEQKTLAFAALRNYVKALREVHSYDGIRELRNMLKGFSDANLRTAKRHRKQKA